MDTNRNESAQHDAEVTKLIKDVETYKDMFQKTETRLSKKIKELTTENKALVSLLCNGGITIQTGLLTWRARRVKREKT